MPIRTLTRRRSRPVVDYADMPAADFERAVELSARNERLTRRKHELALNLACRVPAGYESAELLVSRLMGEVRS